MRRCAQRSLHVRLAAPPLSLTAGTTPGRRRRRPIEGVSGVKGGEGVGRGGGPHCGTPPLAGDSGGQKERDVIKSERGRRCEKGDQGETDLWGSSGVN